MLRSLQIRNYVLIDSLDVRFPEGLVIITGQTGAGKSILLGALSLLLGSKADASVIGGDADSCVVEAVFEVPDSDAAIAAVLKENDLEGESGEVIVRRVVNRSGRSRSFVNDSPVNVQVLQAISSRLVDIHSQHQTLMLSDHGFQLSMLDHYAGNISLLDDCKAAYSEMKSLESELAKVSATLNSLSEERDYNEARFRKLDEAGLKEGELEELEAEQKQLANAEEIKQNLCAAESLFSPQDMAGDALPVASALKEVQRLLEKVGKFIPEAQALARRVESSRIELEDISDEVSSMNSRTEISEDRLTIVEDRMSLLYDLLKQYSAASVSELIAKRDALSEKLFDSTALEARKVELEKGIAVASRKYDSICKELHEARTKASGPFAKSVMDSVHSLELEHAVFAVDVSESSASATGKDDVSFLFSAVGSQPVDVAKCASGGEMSRLMLCLKAMMARFVNMPTLIFDEIDTGVSGSAADKMGQMICSMGGDMQVFAITHLPQVAAKGDAHYLVEKEYDVLGTKASTSIHLIDGEARVMEVARMLSGSQITQAAIANARSLLGE